MPESTGDLITDRHEDLTGWRLAVFDQTRTYRYLLERRWNAGPSALFVMLNPSSADATENDPTIRRCVAFARREGAAALSVVNLFALRSPNPGILRVHPDPVGPANDAVLRDAVHRARWVIGAWGTHGTLHARGNAMSTLLAPLRPWCLGLTANGQPRHPLYLPADTPLTPYSPPTPPADGTAVPADLLALELEHRAEKQRTAALGPGACGYRAYRLGRQVAQHPWLADRPAGPERRAARKALRLAATAAEQQATA